jgi:hypothetical protein
MRLFNYEHLFLYNVDLSQKTVYLDKEGVIKICNIQYSINNRYLL